MERLLDAGADKEKVTNAGRSPLHLVAHQGDQAVAQCLLNADADKEKAHNQGATPSHLAERQRHQAVVQSFLDAGADQSCQLAA